MPTPKDGKGDVISQTINITYNFNFQPPVETKPPSDDKEFRKKVTLAFIQFVRWLWPFVITSLPKILS